MIITFTVISCSNLKFCCKKCVSEEKTFQTVCTCACSIMSVYIQIAHGQEGGDLIFCLKAIIILCHAGGPKSITSLFSICLIPPIFCFISQTHSSLLLLELTCCLKQNMDARENCYCRSKDILKMYFWSNILGHSTSHKWCRAVMQNQRKLAKDCYCTSNFIIQVFFCETITKYYSWIIQIGLLN